MKCMHCFENFYPVQDTRIIAQDPDGYWLVESYLCPACTRINAFLVNARQWTPTKPYCGTFSDVITRVPIRPKVPPRPPCPPEVPRAIADEYKEACLVLADSPKASAALSRRCLQNVLRDKAGIGASDLSREIQQALDGAHLPVHIAEVLQAVRNVGNFAAHPQKSKCPGEILPVESGEAELNLDALETLFDYYYVQPAAIARKRAAFSEKLKEIGKPPK